MLSEYYQAATRTAALAEKDWFGIIRLTGGDRASWLQGMVTNDVQKVAPGAGCYAAHLTPQGKIVAHMQVLIDADALWLFDALSSSAMRRDVKIGRATHLMHLEQNRFALYREAETFLSGGDLEER